MNEDERSLWERYRQGDESAQEELILLYLYLVKNWAERISRIAGWANRDDLRQDGVIGLINAIEKFNPNQGVAFKYYANLYIRGAMLHGSELTRDLARQQGKIYREARQAEAEWTQAHQRIPTIAEVAEKTGYTVEQIQNAIDAMGLAFAGEFPDLDVLSPPTLVEAAPQERTLMLYKALVQLSERKQEVIHLYYWEDQSHPEIAQRLGLSVSNVIKIRQRAIDDLRQLLGVER